MYIIKIDRLIGIITILLQKEKVTAPFLAEKFEVSRRTISRDIEDICKAGIPVVTAQGYDGGISIAEGYRIDKTIFTIDEVQAIFIGLKSLDSISQISYTDRLVHKFSSEKDAMLSLTDSIWVDLSSHYKNSLPEKIGSIKSAIKEQIVISFRYFYSKGEVDKSIEPYLLVFKWSSWYIFGYCLEKKDFRLFKLNRLWNLCHTEQYFLKRELLQERTEFDRYFKEEIKLVAVFDERVKYRLIEEYGVDSFTQIDSGKLLFKMGFVNRENMLNWILSFGDTVQVIEPKEICSELKIQAMNILKKYK
ncbi:Predicted DNA-binding transcriptional regulator YafY, contains an HTH and WYL domains [Anaerovirgula multivorans]|uniref:Predicted DNA-binding transcriptional regulator YafY, contains an HTH and WYL domains n=1 Tax=Anaerovirgula multivorans TaxID=312168 RepID=A0A239IVF6_9FIRM|nr:YafY family protein [Anaerovirgula multivorans]SNS97630.1 Predicted DNA-binding transcriptional regulator YafY, contains an HTH and WYL domains [Anaerovirgula multivorans]